MCPHYKTLTHAQHLGTSLISAGERSNSLSLSLPFGEVAL